MKRELYFDASNITSQKDFHEQFAALLSFPSYYQYNLDDLWTCMTSYIDPKLRLTIYNFDHLQNVFGPHAQALRDIFENLETSLTDIEVFLT